MIAPFVGGLRARPGAITLHGPGTLLQMRVELAERWDVIRIEASPAETVRAVKGAALAELMPGADHNRWVMKLRGVELVHELDTLTEVDARNGSIFLLTHRRRRPVR